MYDRKKAKEENVLGRRIRQIREVKGLSQSVIEKRTNLKREYISKIENGDLTNPTIDTLYKLANGLEVAAWELLEEKLPDQQEEVMRLNKELTEKGKALMKIAVKLEKIQEISLF